MAKRNNINQFKSYSPKCRIHPESETNKLNSNLSPKDTTDKYLTKDQRIEKDIKSIFKGGFTTGLIAH